MPCRENEKEVLGYKAPEPKLCRIAPRGVPQLPATAALSPMRVEAILLTRTKWLNGTVLHYCFFGAPSQFAVPEKQADAIRAACGKWKAVGIGLDLKEVNQLSEAEVRIGYSAARGESASQVGRDVLTVPLNEPTTIYGWDLTTPYGAGTALHELGHVLGMEHEHQNPFAGIKWHEQAVYAALAAPPNNWDRATTYHNILEKLTAQQVQGSTWDPDSIMEYEFQPGLIDEPDQYDQLGLQPPGTLSNADKQWALKWYPPPSAAASIKPFETTVLDLSSGQQADFAIRPSESRKYTVETRGAYDTTLGLFELKNGELHFLAGDDDSGEERSAKISQKLYAGRDYVARLRVNFPGRSGKASLTYW
jgi:hypothetical protein